MTIHDRPEGSKLGMYNYILEIESEKGITAEIRKIIDGIAEVNYRGSFEVMEK